MLFESKEFKIEVVDLNSENQLNKNQVLLKTQSEFYDFFDIECDNDDPDELSDLDKFVLESRFLNHLSFSSCYLCLLKENGKCLKVEFESEFASPESKLEVVKSIEKVWRAER